MKRMMKKTKEKIISVVLLATLSCSAMTGCGSSNFYDSSATDEKSSVSNIDYGFDAGGMEESAESYDSAAGETMEETAVEEGVTSVQTANTSQKIIKTYNYYYETEHFDDAHSYLKEQIKGYNGYIESSQISNSGYETSYRTLYVTARIPAENSDTFVNSLGQLGTVIRQSETAEDVTLQYSDTESRIASLETEQERLNELLAQADSLETIIALEQRMTEVRYELESYQSRKRLYDNLISYSTIEITLEEVRYTVTMDDSTFMSRVTSGLESSFRDITEGFVDFIETIIINCPYFICWAIIIFIIVKIIRGIIRRMARKARDKKQVNVIAQPANPDSAIHETTQPVNTDTTIREVTQLDNACNKESEKK